MEQSQSKGRRISIHSLQVEGDTPMRPSHVTLCLFQSTPSKWRETFRRENRRSRLQFQSTPSKWRETTKWRLTLCQQLFQSTPSKWRETDESNNMKDGECISIHSLQVEGDLIISMLISMAYIFQSTPSKWRETFLFFFTKIIYA